MTLVLYNTLTRRKETFEPLEPGKVKLYVCGPTVYAAAHIGHAMSALVFDVIRRYFEYKGYQVEHVMNFTDVDDKIIKRAHLIGKGPEELAQEQIDEWHAHVLALGALPATLYPRVTETMPEIIKFVQSLIDKGAAYPMEGDVYFRVQADEDYGKLSGRKLDEMQAGTRIEVDERKEHPMDFALWKAAKPGEPAWGSPWGPGRPGWHIECSAMSLAHLGAQIDIHGGGNDLIFPHHENEIAQTESLTGKPFARYWIHNGMLQLGGEKMSKSLGNLVTIAEFLREHSATALRYVVINSSYRNPLTFTEDVVHQAERALERLSGALRPALHPGPGEPAQVQALLEATRHVRVAFEAAMDDDFNTAGALGALFDLVKQINTARDAGVGPEVLGEGQQALLELTAVLGFTLSAPTQQGEHDAAPFIELLLKVRIDLRKVKQYDLADEIRDQLATLGVVVEDGPRGSTWRFG